MPPMSLSHRLLRIVMVLASLGLVALVYAAGGGLSVVAAGLVLGTGYAVLRPGSIAVAVLIIAHAVHWTVSAPAPEGLGPWLALLAGAWLVLLLHLCATAAVTWPEVAPIPRAARRRWGLRTLAVALATVPVWAVSSATRGQSLRGEVSMTYVALAALTLLCGALYAMARQAPRTRR